MFAFAISCFSSIQSLSHIRLFATPCTAARQASLSFTNSWSLLKLTSMFDCFRFTWIHGPNVPGSYAVLLFTASDFTFTTSHIHNWVLLPLCLSLFNPSGVISALLSSIILGTYQPGEFIFQCCIFLPFHTVWGSQGKILK